MEAGEIVVAINRMQAAAFPAAENLRSGHCDGIARNWDGAFVSVRGRACSLVRSLPLGLIGAAGLILVLEWLVVHHGIAASPHSRLTSSWRSARRAAAGPEGQAEILCFGDSLIKLGILPRALEARLGATAYNLAVLGGQAPSSYFLLRQALEEGHRPRAVIVNFSPLLLATDPRFNCDGWIALASPRDRMALAWRSRDPVLAAMLIVHGVLASWEYRYAIREVLCLDRAANPEAQGDNLADDRRAFERNWRLNRGAQVAPRPFVPIEGAFQRPTEGRDWNWLPRRALLQYVGRFLTLAQAQDIPVYWVLTPATSAWRDRNERAGTTQSHRRLVQAYLSRFPGLTVLDGQNLPWEREEFRDPIHLNRDGALRLSLAVARAMLPRTDRTQGDSRWIALDGMADEPRGSMQILAEDLDQSRLATNRGSRGDSVREESR
jgi:hypothetical protein